MGNMIIAIQTLTGIAIAVESPHLAQPEETPNIISVNPHTVLAYHETLPLGEQMVETVLRSQVDLDGDVISIATQADHSLRKFVAQGKVQSPIGFLFFGYTPKGEGTMLGWFYTGDQTRTTRFSPYCTSRPNPIVGYLVKKIYTPDISLTKALELTAYAMTQSKVVLAQRPTIQYEGFNLAAIHPERGFFWLDKEAIESIVKHNQERDRALCIKCANLFLNER